MSRWAARLALLLLMSGFAGEVCAQVECDPGETMIRCWAREVRESRGETEEAVESEEEEDLREKPTGVQTAGTNLLSNTSDFLPLLALTGLLGDVQEGETEGTYALDLNFLIPGFVHENNSKLKAVVNSQPKVSDGLKEQLPDDRRDDLVGELEETLGDLSDYSVSYTFNWMDRRHGRGFSQYSDRIAALFFAVKMPASEDEEEFEAQRNLGDLAATLPPSPDPFKTPFQDLANGEEVKVQVEAAITEFLEGVVRLREAIEGAGLDRLGDLLDNQPQLTFLAQKRFRDPLVGGDEMSFKLTYEWGFWNFNRALSRDCDRELDTTQTDRIDRGTLGRCLGEYTDFVDQHEDEIKDGQKLSFSAELVDMDEETFDLPEQGLTGLKNGGARKIVIQGGWSRLFPAGEAGDMPVRLDFVGRYEDVSDDPMRRDRGVATLTVTRQFGDLAVPFGIVYANHGEYLGEVDEQLSAHLGLKFDLEGDGGDD